MRPRLRSLPRAVALLILLSACGDADFSSMGGINDGDCAGNWANLALRVDPPQVTRGDPVTIEIIWEVTSPLSEPVLATLMTGDGAIEVDVPLDFDPAVADPLTYAGQQLNPFGNGAPAGSVSVLATGAQRDGCAAPATATASFLLD